MELDGPRGDDELRRDAAVVWKYLTREGIGAHQRCLDIGCGSGLLTVQLARNGAAHVHALDIDEAAVELFAGKADQIRRVEELSDAYHLRLGDHEAMVAYLIEVTRGP